MRGSIVWRLAAVAGFMALAATAASAAQITFSGTTVASSGTGMQEPWYNSYAFWYLDGYNHAPRVDPAYYTTPWPGTHGGTGTSASGWTSIVNATPSRYAFDFEGYSLDCEIIHTNVIDPRYGHEDRWYVGAVFTIWDTNTSTAVASGTMGRLYEDINFAGAGQKGMVGAALLTLANDAGAFYNEVVGMSGSNQALMTFSCYTDPVLHFGNYDRANWWGTYSDMVGQITVVPEPATLTLLATGLLGAFGFARRPRS